MVFLYPTIVIPFALATILVVLVWYIVIAGYRAPAIRVRPHIRILFLLYIVTFFLLSWFIIYMTLPTSVGVTWYFLTLSVVLGGITLLISTEFTRYPRVLIATLLIIGIINWRFIGLFAFAALMLGFMLRTFTAIHWRQTTIKPYIIIFVLVVSMGVLGGNQLIYTSHDNAQYFDSLLTYDHGLPLESAVTATDLPLIPREYAISLMQKSNSFGANTIITDVSLGMINKSAYWIGAVSYGANQYFSSPLNRYLGFIAVHTANGTVIIISQEFFIGESLVGERDLHHAIYANDSNYICSGSYFSMTPSGEMRLLVPYSIQAKPLLSSASNAGLITQEIQLRGGVLEFNAFGQLVHKYTDLQTLPLYASYLPYNTAWLNREIGYWSESLIGAHEFGIFTHLDPSFNKYRLQSLPVTLVRLGTTAQQFSLLTDADNTQLRGAIKANQSGIYYYNWSQYNLLGPDQVYDNIYNILESNEDTQVLSILKSALYFYPIVDSPKSLADYVYIVLLKRNYIDFGGVAIVSPFDLTGESIELSTINEGQSPELVVSTAISNYVASLMYTVEEGNFTIKEKYNYVAEGSTVYVMTGQFLDSNRTIIFSQEYILSVSEWILVVVSVPSDMLYLQIIYTTGNYYAIHVSIP